MRSLNIFLSTLFLFCFAQTSADDHSKQENSDIRFESMILDDGIFMIYGVEGFTGGNIALLSGNDGVVMIDDSMPPLIGPLRQMITKLADRAPHFILNTHFHADHTGNNSSFATKDAHIIAHHNTRTRLLDKLKEGKNSADLLNDDSLPVMTIPGDTKFYLNGHTLEIIHFPSAHTDGDLAIRFVEADIIHTGDLFFNNMFPYIDVDHGGNAKGYLAAQKKLLSMASSKTKIIPGHGPQATKSQLESTIAMLENSIDKIEALVKKGKTEEEVVKINPLKKYHKDWNWRFITTEKMTRQVYKSVSKK